MIRTKPWELSDKVWERLRLLIPERSAHPKGGRPAKTRSANAVGHAVCAAYWHPMECAATGTGSLHHRLRSFSALGGARRVCAHLASGIAGIGRIGSNSLGMAKQGRGHEPSAPFGGAATGANPTDRGKQGTKRSQLSDARGMPLAVMVAGANRNDRKVVEGTLESIRVARPTPTGEAPQHLCLDAG
jgi:putative transposase